MLGLIMHTGRVAEASNERPARSFVRPPIEDVVMRTSAALVIAVAVLLTGVACSSRGGSLGGSGCRGGTLYVLNQADATGDPLDPARMYGSGGGLVSSMIFRALTTRHRAPGEASDEVVPDLATDTGKASDGAKTWTYRLKKGLKFEDGADHLQGRQVGGGAELLARAPRRHPVPAGLDRRR